VSLDADVSSVLESDVLSRNLTVRVELTRELKRARFVHSVSRGNRVNSTTFGLNWASGSSSLICYASSCTEAIKLDGVARSIAHWPWHAMLDNSVLLASREASLKNILQGAFMNTVAARILLQLLSSSGPAKFTLVPCPLCNQSRSHATPITSG
jgi:hypothetical protein